MNINAYQSENRRWTHCKSADKIHEEKENVKYFLRRLFLLAWPTKDNILFITTVLLHEDPTVLFLLAKILAEIAHMWVGFVALLVRFSA